VSVAQGFGQTMDGFSPVRSKTGLAGVGLGDAGARRW
jgi:hypothetical protein